MRERLGKTRKELGKTRKELGKTRKELGKIRNGWRRHCNNAFIPSQNASWPFLLCFVLQPLVDTCVHEHVGAQALWCRT